MFPNPLPHEGCVHIKEVCKKGKQLLDVVTDRQGVGTTVLYDDWSGSFQKTAKQHILIGLRHRRLTLPGSQTIIV